MKKDAERRGAEEAPISLTLGTESGSGVVSIRPAEVNLWNRSKQEELERGSLEPRGKRREWGGYGSRGGGLEWIVRQAGYAIAQ